MVMTAATDQTLAYLARGGAVDPLTTYPSAHATVARSQLPIHVKDLFWRMQSLATTNPIVSPAIYKMSAFSVTDIVYETENGGLHKDYVDLFDGRLRLRQHSIESMLDLLTYGITFTSLQKPFRKLLTCRKCKHTVPATQAKFRFYGYRFHLHCRKCGHRGQAIVEDKYYVSPYELRLIRWNPRYIDIVPTGQQGVFRYRLLLSPQLRNDLFLGKDSVVANTPQDYIDALRDNRPIYFGPDEIFVIRRSGPSIDEEGWGIPLALAVLQETDYLQILRRSQEAIAYEHLVPLRVLYPAGNATDPNRGPVQGPGMLNLSQWQAAVREEVLRWKKDPNHIPIMPLPIGMQSIGGDGRALVLHQELRVWADFICAGMGVPSEFIFGGVSWSGSTVSMRFVQNLITSYQRDAVGLVNWVIRRVAAATGWTRLRAHFKPFTAMDDIQRRQLDMQLALQGRLSWHTLFADMDRDYDEESEQVLRELETEARRQRRQSLLGAQSQIEVQQLMSRLQPQPAGMPLPGDPNALPPQAQAMSSMASPMTFGDNSAGGQPASVAPNGIDMRLAAANLARQLQAMTDGDREATLQQIQLSSPELAGVVQQYLYQPDPRTMQPLPAQLPPRRQLSV